MVSMDDMIEKALEKAMSKPTVKQRQKGKKNWRRRPTGKIHS